VFLGDDGVFDAGVLDDGVLDPTDAAAGVVVELVTGEVVDDADTSVFPTVDSGRFTTRIAFAGLNPSGVTTSMYAHAGTEVALLIAFGYLSPCR